MIERGLIQMVATGVGLLNKGEKYPFQIEVKELERAGNMSKVNAVEVFGGDKNARKQIKEQFPQWIPTKDIQELEQK